MPCGPNVELIVTKRPKPPNRTEFETSMLDHNLSGSSTIPPPNGFQSNITFAKQLNSVRPIYDGSDNEDNNLKPNELQQEISKLKNSNGILKNSNSIEIRNHPNYGCIL